MPQFSPRVVLIGGALILALSLGIRHTFGLFLQPMTMANGWGRETFGLAIAVQNLVWGLAQPFVGLEADRRGAGRMILGGAVFYALGLVGMALATTTTGFLISAGVLIGIGLAGTTMPVVFGAISRALPPEQRSMAFGVAMSVGSIGQFLMLPMVLGLIDSNGPALSLVVLSVFAALILPLAVPLMERNRAAPRAAGPTPRQALRLALGDRGFQLLSFGFFVCGFQVVFIAVHLPAYLGDQGLSPGVGSAVLALIGLFNIFGSLAAGWLGGRYRKPWLLSGLYLGRAIAITGFLLLPLSAATAYGFAVLMGLFWLSTVPLTNGVVATMFGTRNMAMLGGLIFLAHQVGSFLGGWLGGVVYDRWGSYDLAWIIAIALSLVATLVNLPIKDQPVVQGAQA